MGVYQSTVSISTNGKGTQEITDLVVHAIDESKLMSGIASVFCHHTSCSLVLMEGPDDMPSHIKMALTRSSETIPFANGRPDLGTWQGLFLWEHRSSPHQRKVSITLVGE